MSRRRRLSSLVAALAVTVGAATACTEANGTEGKDYVSGDGIVTLIDRGERKAPVEVSGETLDGGQLDLADLRGEVVVVNVWGAWCSECRTEMPMLVDAVEQAPEGTAFVGVDVRDASRDNALAFERTYGVTYPSLWDPGSETLLAFPEPYNPRATPSTMVLDREGRVAALITGRLPSTLTLLDVVEEVAAEDG